jgi:hypothetical protein
MNAKLSAPEIIYSTTAILKPLVVKLGKLSGAISNLDNIKCLNINSHLRVFSS